MDTNLSKAQELITRPAESLSVELKRWIDPSTPEGKAKIIKASMALYNFNGGYLVIGFDNETLEPDNGNKVPDVKKAFHIDIIQGIVSKYASILFEISIEFPERDGQLYPVIVIPSGVKVPVAAKRDLQCTNDKQSIKVNDVYIRSLGANNTPSTTKARHDDWATVVDICFDNREADIGRFIRRHLGGTNTEAAKELVAALSDAILPEPSIAEKLTEYLDESKQRYEGVVTERNLEIPKHGSWEIALLIDGNIPKHSANLSFLKLLIASHPDYSGWPIWVISLNFNVESYKPYLHNGTWEALINTIGDIQVSEHIDFMRLDPQGRFYLYRALYEDMKSRHQYFESETIFHFDRAITDVAEAIAVGITFAKAMGCETEETTLSFEFRWTGLQNRLLRRSSEPGYMPERKAYADNVMSQVNVPLDTPLSAIGNYVHEVVTPLLEKFDDFAISIDAVDRWTSKLFKR